MVGHLLLKAIMSDRFWLHLIRIVRLECVAASLYYFSKCFFFCVGQHSLLSVIIFPIFVPVGRFSILAFIDADSTSAIDFFHIL